MNQNQNKTEVLRIIDEITNSLKSIQTSLESKSNSKSFEDFEQLSIKVYKHLQEIKKNEQALSLYIVENLTKQDSYKEIVRSKDLKLLGKCNQLVFDNICTLSLNYLRGELNSRYDGLIVFYTHNKKNNIDTNYIITEYKSRSALGEIKFKSSFERVKLNESNFHLKELQDAFRELSDQDAVNQISGYIRQTLPEGIIFNFQAFHLTSGSIELCKVLIEPPNITQIVDKEQLTLDNIEDYGCKVLLEKIDKNNFGEVFSYFDSIENLLFYFFSNWKDFEAIISFLKRSKEPKFQNSYFETYFALINMDGNLEQISFFQGFFKSTKSAYAEWKKYIAFTHYINIFSLISGLYFDSEKKSVSYFTRTLVESIPNFNIKKISELESSISKISKKDLRRQISYLIQKLTNQQSLEIIQIQSQYYSKQYYQYPRDPNIIPKLFDTSNASVETYSVSSDIIPIKKNPIDRNEESEYEIKDDGISSWLNPLDKNDSINKALEISFENKIICKEFTDKELLFGDHKRFKKIPTETSTAETLKKIFADFSKRVTKQTSNSLFSTNLILSELCTLIFFVIDSFELDTKKFQNSDIINKYLKLIEDTFQKLIVKKKILDLCGINKNTIVTANANTTIGNIGLSFELGSCSVMDILIKIDALLGKEKHNFYNYDFEFEIYDFADTKLSKVSLDMIKTSIEFGFYFFKAFIISSVFRTHIDFKSYQNIIEDNICFVPNKTCFKCEEKITFFFALEDLNIYHSDKKTTNLIEIQGMILSILLECMKNMKTCCLDSAYEALKTTYYYNSSSLINIGIFGKKKVVKEKKDDVPQWHYILLPKGIKIPTMLYVKMIQIHFEAPYFFTILNENLMTVNIKEYDPIYLIIVSFLLTRDFYFVGREIID